MNKTTTYFMIFSALFVGIIFGIFIHDDWPTHRLSRKGQATIEEITRLIKEEYVDTVNIEKLSDNAIQYILSQLDPYSTYISSKDRVEANESLRGSFEGVGIEFNIFRDTLIVITPLSGGPAEKVGMIAGDKIITIEGELVAGVGLTNRGVINRLKGSKDTKVTVGVLRKHDDSLLSFTISRGKIPRFSLDVAYMIDDTTGYIKLSRFAQTTHSEFTKAMQDLRKKGMVQLILDLRNNPGGYMDQAIKLADEFLPSGQKIVSTSGRVASYDADVKATHEGSFEQGSLVVIINEGSSSASEIVAGALQDNDRALIVGRRSYGKGLVQSSFSLSDGSELRLTVSKYYTPSGRSIQRPYKNARVYADDMIERHRRGEFFHADSVWQNDSLQYFTIGGRKIYGGGGIAPDYFVPLDTARFSTMINKLLQSNILQEYTFQYAVKHRERLQEKGLLAFTEHFDASPTMIKQLLKTAKKQNMPKEYHRWTDKDQYVLKILVKSNIARRVWGEKGFYTVYNKNDKMAQRAKELLLVSQQKNNPQ